ncbi:MAG: hypothetical protein ACOC80_10695 [Petrotogales bacterium]
MAREENGIKFYGDYYCYRGRYMTVEFYEDLAKMNNDRVTKDDFLQTGKTVDEFELFAKKKDFWDEYTDEQRKKLNVKIETFSDFQKYIFDNFLKENEKEYIRDNMRKDLDDVDKAKLFPGHFAYALILFLNTKQIEQIELKSLEAVK